VLGCKGRNNGSPGTESAVVALPGDSSASAPRRDHRSVAEKVVTQSAGVKQGDGLEPLQSAYDAAGPGKDVLGVIDIGINPGIKSPERSPVHVWGKAGTVTVLVGNNTWAGGDNQVRFGIPAYSPGSTLTVDGKPLVQEGRLVAAEDVADR